MPLSVVSLCLAFAYVVDVELVAVQYLRMLSELVDQITGESFDVNIEMCEQRCVCVRRSMRICWVTWEMEAM